MKRLKVKIFADGANLASMIALAQDPTISGFTTNPTLMRQAGIRDYKVFAVEVLQIIREHPVCFEVLADRLDEMAEQAQCIASWGPNAIVKIPVMNTKGQFTGPIIQQLSAEGIRLNITAILTLQQVQQVASCLSASTPAIVSVFAGRIADTGIDPLPVMQEALMLLRSLPQVELLWASCRELLNIVQADTMGCHIVTATPDLLAKRHLIGKDLHTFSLETVKMFYDDAMKAGLLLDAFVV